ncbi:hypothetical protein HDV02_006115 [Globomyces sp. JEL0801]|nr:hypothetical protein HDV02_006115 [Globomyces sp. JEL0801]
MGTVLSKLFPNDYELVVTKSKELDHILQTKFNATGASLNEKLGSIQSQLSPPLAKKIRYLIRIRNKLLYQHDCHCISDRAEFIDNFESAMEELDSAIQRRQLSQCFLIAGSVSLLALLLSQINRLLLVVGLFVLPFLAILVWWKTGFDLSKLNFLSSTNKME